MPERVIWRSGLMNSLSNDYYGGWEIFSATKGYSCIRSITEKESVIHLKLPEIKKEQTQLQLPEVTEKKKPPQQQLLFEF